MKILFLTNNLISKPLIQWMKNIEEIIEINYKISTNIILKFEPDFIISYNYRYIIKDDVINLMNNQIINLHISYLPFNKGAYPNVWSILDDTPKGVTIHLIDKGIDTGDIIVQKKLNFDNEKETLKSSYELLHKEIQDLFKSNWEKIKEWKITQQKQEGEGTIHFIKDFTNLQSLIGTINWDMKLKTFKNKYRDPKLIK
jgi:methionyl-tRNA formyltransferase